MIGKNKIIAAVTIIVVATFLSSIMLMVYANDDVTASEGSINLPVRLCRPRWSGLLTEEQQTELKSMTEAFQNEIESKLEEWGVKIEPGWMSNLTEDQGAELQAIRQEFRDSVSAKLKEWGIEIPEFKGPFGWLNDLTEEQRAELEALQEEYMNAVREKLDAWGVEVPEFQGRIGVMGFGRMPRRGGGLGFRGFRMP